jgi:hypothetical protein
MSTREQAVDELREAIRKMAAEETMTELEVCDHDGHCLVTFPHRGAIVFTPLAHGAGTVVWRAEGAGLLDFTSTDFRVVLERVKREWYSGG